MTPTYPLTRDIVLIGGGHTHALVLRKWAMKPLPGARLTLIDPRPAAAYSGMLPGFVAGHYALDDLNIDLVRLARIAGARLILGRATGIDRAAGAVMLSDHLPVKYDVCSIDIGIHTAMEALPGFADHAVPVKPLEPFAQRWQAFRDAPGPVAVIGGGIAGAELSMAMAHSLKQSNTPQPVHLIDTGAILSDFDDQPRARLLDALDREGVTLHPDSNVAQVSGAGVRMEDGTELPARFVTGAAGPRPYHWLEQTGLTLHEGAISVGSHLQSSDPRVFAAGDCAYLSHAPRPKAGVYAVRAAPALFHNLRVAAMGSGRMKAYHPQSDYLKLVSLGGKRAFAEKAGRGVSGALLWRWKDRIDQNFMRKFRDLAPMKPPALPKHFAAGMAEAQGAHPHCAGCGAKVGKGALGDALAQLPASPRSDIAPLPGDDAALLGMGDTRQVLTTDHLRAVVDDPVRMTRIALTHAMGDIWAMGAAPQAALAQVILPRMSPALQRRTMEEITQTAHTMLHGFGAALVGGHSSMGDSLTIGFALSGLCDRDPITLRGARAGDALILTKPIGSGTLMAADMRGQARGQDIAACWDQMAEPQDRASEALRVAHAMTDVTGFGLAGHLWGMCEASHVAAKIDLAAIPLMTGAEALAADGVRSTLWDDNRAAVAMFAGPVGARTDLLFDPQTAGGLLAAVPDGAAALDALKRAGVQGWEIGRIIAGTPEIAAR